ncbi:MAG: hypothetical protein R2809_10375 [Flavobacteriales bacterium]
MKLSPQKFLLGMFSALWTFSSLAQTTLSPGDLVVIAYNFDNSDQFVFVPLVDLESGTVIKFTDNGWNGTSLTTSEGTYTWTASAPVAKGTKISVLPTSWHFSTSGDQFLLIKEQRRLHRLFSDLALDHGLQGASHQLHQESRQVLQLVVLQLHFPVK